MTRDRRRPPRGSISIDPTVKYDYPDSSRRHAMFESFVDSNGVNIWTTRTGEGYPVMLCNGGAGCCDYLAPVAGMLDDMAQVIRHEQRGCGRSQPAPPYDIETCLIDLENIRLDFEAGNTCAVRLRSRRYSPELVG